MELTHEFTVPAPVDRAWATLMDLERVGGCFPGATVTEVTDDGFSGTVKVKLGPIALVYTGSGTFAERDDTAHRAVIEAKGKDKRGNGTAGATVVLELVPDGDGTRVDVRTDLAITGKPAQFGRGVMQDVSDKLLQAFVACIEAQIGSDEADHNAGEQDPPLTTTDAPPAAEPAAGPSAGPSAATTPAPPVPGSPVAPRTPVGDDALDLGGTVLPVVLTTVRPYLLAGLVGAAIGYLLGRSSRS